jgi:hypothetical protein
MQIGLNVFIYDGQISIMINFFLKLLIDYNRNSS